MKSSFSNDQELIQEDWCTRSNVSNLIWRLLDAFRVLQEEISDLEEFIENDDPNIDQQILVIRDLVHFYQVRLTLMLQHSPESYAQLLKSLQRFESWTPK